MAKRSGSYVQSINYVSIYFSRKHCFLFVTTVGHLVTQMLMIQLFRIIFRDLKCAYFTTKQEDVKACFCFSYLGSYCDIGSGHVLCTLFSNRADATPHLFSSVNQFLKLR